MTIGVEPVERPERAAPESTAPSVAELDGTCGLGRDRIGGKAWSVDHMRALGLPVPPAFAVTTEGWADFRERGALSEEIWLQVRVGVAALERGTGRRFGDTERPLLVSVRSGAAVSMPGMMDTVLNLGINDDVERALAAETRNPGYAADTHGRFRSQYREIVLGDPLGAVPQDPWEQLRGAIAAVFRSWDSARAKTYRRSRGVSDDLGTAVTVQAMVFGNLDALSGTGVLFSRNPNTGERTVFGEWLVGGQGEDVVSGRTTPRPLDELAVTMPDVHRQLLAAADLLERDGRDIQDIEFTVESGRLWLLQSRPAKRSARAAVRAAVAMAGEGLIDPATALSRVDAEQVRTVLRPASGIETDQPPLARGESACPGLASGIVVTDPDEAETRAAAGEDVVLARPTTSPDDLHGMIAARAIVTELGGATSHAALVSRELGRPCVVGCGPGVVATLAGRVVTVDGGAGAVWLGEVTGKAVEDSVIEDVAQLARLAGVHPDELVGLLAARDGENGFSATGSVENGHMTAGTSPASDEVLSHTTPRGSRTQQHITPDLDLLRLIGIKGRVAPDAVADSLAGDATETGERCADLVARGLCASTPVGVRLTPEGRAELTRLLDAERETVDPTVIATAYDEFCAFNAELKEIITAWQMKDAATVNDHTDAAYDAAVLDRLRTVHGRVVPLVRRIGEIAPRLSRYADRLDRAVERIDGGDHTWVARPIMDSYHTVWFELHEDLIGLCGLSRADEAAAGRAH
ncbi:pyruvate, phosphate dikinase [Nocardia amikacinitolerans]|uniref:pyruvate, phosphate dikinase n=1 Tax=Nocardia amikacinitolerans TaxID=756689 RepID=UPI0020A56F40|nr:pyruvate, phosphate dikinase [Nocardia amikacinitolerans]MCP2288527.1 pyruvate, orthophosphate dikinase [Nocardia amikacinitolerans]